MGDWIASFGSRAVADLFVDENIDGYELMGLTEKGFERLLRPLVDKERMPAVVNLLSERRDELLPMDIKELVIAVTALPVETQDEHIPTCKVCLETFNHTSRSLHVLSACGHSVCKACILQMRALPALPLWRSPGGRAGTCGEHLVWLKVQEHPQEL